MNQAETVHCDEIRVDGENVASSVGKDTSEDKAKAKAKAKAEEPSEEEVRSAVAGVILAEAKLWPEGVTKIIGGEHPNEESFVRGVPYVIGAYMHIARRTLSKRVHARKRKAELKTAEMLSPLAKESRELASQFQASRDQFVQKLREDRDKELKETKRAINAKYSKLIGGAKTAKPPEKLVVLWEREAEIKHAFANACTTVDAEVKDLKDQINSIDDAAKNWSSKERKALRASNGDAS